MAKAVPRIGIFDSGAGGLTVARALADALPACPLLYVGDNAHMPYGGKSLSAVQHYASGITQWLVQQSCDAIAIACHSVSCVAMPSVQQAAGAVRVMNVVEPTLQHLLTHYNDARVVLIGTRHTIGSGAYARALAERGSSIQLTSVATPVLASLVEEGFIDVPAVQLVWDRYLKDIDWAKVDALVLGCTHYPLLLPALKKMLGEQLAILDPAVFLAEQMKQWCARYFPKAMEEPSLSDSQFYLTDRAEQFVSIAHGFFQKKIDVQALRLWD